MSRFVIAATGTDIGKTLLTAALTWQLRHDGKQVCALKPIATGFNPYAWEQSDTAHILNSLEKPLTLAMADTISPWRFEAPLSPDMASEKEQKSLKLHTIIEFCQKQSAQAEITFMEGVGGVMSPINAKQTQLDLMSALGWPVLLGCGSYVGAITHLLTAVLALETRGVGIHAIWINETPDSAAIFEETAASIKTHTGNRYPIICIKRQAPTTVPLWTLLPNLKEIIT